MTLSIITELEKSAARVELILAIEGVGWPVSYTNLALGFDGDLWSTADLDGDLQTVLDGSAGSCTLHGGLEVVLGSRSYNPRDGTFSSGTLTAAIADGDDWWADNYHPAAEPTEGIELSANVGYNDTTIDIDDGTVLLEGDVVWLNGVEAVKLGTKSSISGTEYRFTGCTRAYLGTPRGDIARMQRNVSGFVWLVETRVLDVHQVWYDRLVQVFAHVPGEPAVNMSRLFSGGLRANGSTFTGDKVTISAVGSPMVRPSQEIWRPKKIKTQPSRAIWPPDSEWRGGNQSHRYTRPEMGLKNSILFQDMASTPDDDTTSLIWAYRYRTEPGGTAGARSTWLTTTNEVQAAESGEDSQTIMRFCKMGDKVMLAERAVRSGSVLDGAPISKSVLKSFDRRRIQIEAWSSVGTNSDQISSMNQWDQLPEGVAWFLLDNWFDTAVFNDYSRNGVVSRNIVDVFLHHLMSRDDEYVIENTTTGSTTTVIQFASAIAPSADFYVGAALFCVEGANKGESRVILSNTTTSVTVEDAFSNAPATGKEYQIRNTVYDTLPLGWGLGVPWYNVDIDSFEEVRDKYLSEANCDRFVLGANEKLNIWEMIQKNILEAYGIAVTVSGTTGKMTARYVGTPVGDGVDGDYVTVTESDILDASDVTYDMRPIATVRILVRAVDDKIVSFLSIGSERAPAGGSTTAGRTGTIRTGLIPVIRPVVEQIPATMGSDQNFNYVQASDVYGFNENELDMVELVAEFDSVDTLKNLRPRAESIIKDFSKPKPYVSLKLSLDFLDVELGDIVKVTSLEGAVNPFAPGRDWANVLGRVIGIDLDLMSSDPGVTVTLELLSDVSGGRIAPASNLTGAFKGSDGTSAYFICDPAVFTANAATDKDYYGFAVGDRIEVRDSTGLTRGAVYTIRSFGANDVSDPTQASSDIVRVNETISPTLAAGDYITFSDWSVSNTARMDLYAALADPTTELLATVDPARRYG